MRYSCSVPLVKLHLHHASMTNDCDDWMFEKGCMVADAVVSAAMGLPWIPLLFMGLGTTAFTLWVSHSSISLASARR